jgi:LuxR family maltose regulon positive regulatory protein
MVRRERLRTVLDENVPYHRLILISAPAGAGKTTLMADWARSTARPAAWLTAGREDADPERFLRYLLAAWEKVRPEIGESDFAALLSSPAPDIQAALDAWLHAAERMPGQQTFCLDDYQQITDPAVHEALTFLLDHLPPNLHFILTTRNEPPLPVARYRAHRQLFEIDAKNLNFTPEETETFLNRSMALELAPEQVAALQVGTEGWAAGLQLAALGLHRSPGEPGLPTVSGRQRFIADYLRTDVLARLPEAMQRFLLRTSILERLSGSLCEAVSGERGGQAMLERLEQENLFVIPLDDRREWFRYHSLFAEFLQAELQRRQSGEVSELHRRAERWYAAHDLPDPAFRHALASGDPREVVRVGEQYIALKILSGDLAELGRWLDAIPADWYAAQPMLRFARAAFLLQIGAVDACVRSLDKLEAEVAPAESPAERRLIARIQSLRCGLACFRNDLKMAETFSDQALPELGEDDLFFQAMTYFNLGDTYRRHGQWEQAEANYRKVLQFAQAPFFRFLAVHEHGALADLYLRQGRLRRAAEHWRKALAAVRERQTWGSIPLPVAGWVHIRLGETLYEYDRLLEADAHVLRGLELAELGGDMQARIVGYLAVGRLRLAQGDELGAEAYLEKARPLVEQAQFPDWAGRFERLQLELWLAQDRPRAALDWAESALAATSKDETGSEAARLAAARALTVCGDAGSVQRAAGLLKRLAQAAADEGRIGVQIEALALQSLADWRRGEHPGARAAAESALRMAEAEGFVRLFVDLGLPMARVLQAARDRAVLPEYVDRLLEAFEDGLAGEAESPLPEPLTSREHEVLELIAAGLTNREIAAELVISPGTVKKHTGNIYGKLGVSSRTQAAARARELGWLN